VRGREGGRQRLQLNREDGEKRDTQYHDKKLEEAKPTNTAIIFFIYIKR
jgi:hypothetical protein